MKGWPKNGTQFNFVIEFVCKCGAYETHNFMIVNGEYIPEILCFVCERRYKVSASFREK